MGVRVERPEPSFNEGFFDGQLRGSVVSLAAPFPSFAAPMLLFMDDELRDICKAMAQMAPGVMFASFEIC